MKEEQKKARETGTRRVKTKEFLDDIEFMKYFIDKVGMGIVDITGIFCRKLSKIFENPEIDKIFNNIDINKLCILDLIET